MFLRSVGISSAMEVPHARLPLPKATSASSAVRVVRRQLRRVRERSWCSRASAVSKGGLRPKGGAAVGVRGVEASDSGEVLCNVIASLSAHACNLKCDRKEIRCQKTRLRHGVGPSTGCPEQCTTKQRMYRARCTGHTSYRCCENRGCLLHNNEIPWQQRVCAASITCRLLPPKRCLLHDAD